MEKADEQERLKIEARKKQMVEMAKQVNDANEMSKTIKAEAARKE